MRPARLCGGIGRKETLSTRQGLRTPPYARQRSKMRYHKLLPQALGVMLIIVITLSLIGCGTQQPERACEAPAERAASKKPTDLWVDATKTTIGVTKGWTNKVELADINGDKLVDVLFANGGDYETPGKPDFSKVFLNQGPDQMFEGATRQVFGPNAMLARVINV